MLTAAAWSQQLPELWAVKMYQDILLKDVGKSAEEAGHTQEALAAYWTVAHFGDRLQSKSSPIMQLFSVMLRENAYKQMLPLLRREGRTGEAAAVESARSGLPTLSSGYDFPRDPALEASATRSAHMLDLAGFLLIVFGAATTVWLLCTIALRWKPSLSRGLNRVASVLSFTPPLLFFASSMLLVAYYPYARPIGQIASREELTRGYTPFLMDLYNYSFLNFGFITDLWIARMFWPVVWCAVVAIAGALLLSWAARRPRPDDTGLA
jgi:hypothetical protein